MVYLEYAPLLVVASVWACVPAVGWYAAIRALRLVVYRVYDVAVLGCQNLGFPVLSDSLASFMDIGLL